MFAGLFTIVTVEILPIGLLTSIAEDFEVTPGKAGLAMTAPGLVAAVAAPAVTVLFRRLDRRTVLTALALLLAAASLLGAAAEAFPVLLASRVLVGVVIGGFWSVGAGLAERLVRKAALATTVIFTAVPLGSVLGVPAGTLLGRIAGWRTAFVVAGLFAVLVGAALAAFLPRLPPATPTSAGVLMKLLRRRRTRAALLVTALVVAAHFGTYTYVTPFLLGPAEIGAELVSTLLLLYGAAGIAGNALAGVLLRKDRRTAFATAAALLACAMLLLPLTAAWRPATIALLVVWGVGYGAVPACSQAWFADAAEDAPEGAAVLFTASFQAVLALGALTGGEVLDATSPAALLITGGVIAGLAVPVGVLCGWRRRP